MNAWAIAVPLSAVGAAGARFQMPILRSVLMTDSDDRQGRGLHSLLLPR